MAITERPWYEIDDAEKISSPALVIYRSRIIENIERVIASVPSVEQLRPHVKTHKMKEVARLMMDHGITRFKCATIEEAGMLGSAGAPDVLLAYQPTGPLARRVLETAMRFPATRYSAIVDDAEAVSHLSSIFATAGKILPLFIDLNVGMNRTGVSVHAAPALAAIIRRLPGVRLTGLHAYDGHIHDKDLSARGIAVKEAFEGVFNLRETLDRQSPHPLTLVAGGSPTYLFHLGKNEEASPGTFVFWDRGYQQKIPEQPFEFAALLMSRVISRPNDTSICTDLGYKSVAAEQPQPRIYFLNAPEAVALGHSEEHLTLTVPDARKYEIGQVLYGVPTHICPSVALYQYAMVVENRQLVGRWEIARR